MSFRDEEPRVAIVGAGIAGIAIAIALKTRLGFTNFVVRAGAVRRPEN